jgi:acyl-CoA dehydrogenase
MQDRLQSLLPKRPSSDAPRRDELLARVASLPGDLDDPRRILAALTEAGLFAECVPASHGGAGESVSVRSLCLVRAALAYLSPLYDLMFAMQGLGSYAVTLAGSAAQKDALLPKVTRGEAICAIALTEPGAGSDLSGIATTAQKQPDGGYVLDGEKVFISNAGLATDYVLYARTGPHPKRGLSAFLLPGSAEGLHIEPMRLLCDDHPIGRLTLRGVRLPAAARIGDEGQGMTLALGTLFRFRPSVGAAALGMARRALDEATQRVKARQQFGQPLSAFQGTQLALAEMATDCAAAALLVQHSAELLDAGHGDARTEEEAATASAMAKLYATEAAQRVVDRALQLHGGEGLLAGSIIERLYRDVRALRIYEGTSEIQKLIIARSLLR